MQPFMKVSSKYFYIFQHISIIDILIKKYFIPDGGKKKKLSSKVRNQTFLFRFFQDQMT